MKPIQVQIKKSKNWTKPIFIIGIVFICLGGISSNMEMDHPLRTPILLFFLVGGLLLMLGIKIINPTNDIGLLRISQNEIEIGSKSKIRLLETINIKQIRVHLEGEHLALKKTWTPFSGDMFPFLSGNKNVIQFTLRDATTIKTNFYLDSDLQSRVFIRTIEELCKNLNIELVVNN